MGGRLSILEQEARIREGLTSFKSLIDWDFIRCRDKTVICLLQTIHDNLFEEHMNVSWLEAECGFHGPEVLEQFKRYTKFRVRDYIENRRILAAMWLLWDNDLDISTISYWIGYSNYRTFARAFRRQVGCSPLEYRNRWSRDSVH